MKKKKVPEPTVIPQDASNLELFQAQHGEDWQRITAHPAFLAGLQLLNVRAFSELTSLSFEDIDKYGLLVLSVLIGRLKHEYDMKNLHKEKTQTFPVDEDVIYISPEEQAAHEQLREKYAEENRKRYG